MHRLLLTLVVLLALFVAPLSAKGPAATTPEEAGPDFAVQGEYLGEVNLNDGETRTLGVQVIALGDGKFQAVGFPKGLPGEGWSGHRLDAVPGQTKGDKTVLGSDDVKLVITGDTMSAQDGTGKELGKLKKVHRKSKTLGAKPPQGAVVLFDGTGVEHFPGAKMTEDGLLIQGATSKQKFGSGTLHVEFMLPFMPQARSQARGNSGCYLQGRYEVQMLDSFGLEGKSNECGGIYSVHEPSVNMCYPPLSWQTYDIDFTAAEFTDGKKTADARLTVRHNGVVIHDDVAVPGPTRAAPVKAGPEPGPIYLQNHGNPVRYRNIWFVEKE